MPRDESAEQQQRVQPQPPVLPPLGPRAGPASPPFGASEGGEARPRFPLLPPPPSGGARGGKGGGASPPRRSPPPPPPPAPAPRPGPQGSPVPRSPSFNGLLTAPRLTALGRVRLCPLPRRGAAPRRALALPVQLLLEKGQGRVLLGQGQRGPDQGQGQDGQRHP